MDNKNIGIDNMTHHQPKEIPYNKHKFLKMASLMTLYMKKMNISYAEACKQKHTEKFKKFQKENIIISPLKDIYNKLNNDLINMKISIKKKYNKKVVDMVLFSQMTSNKLTEWIERNNTNTFEIIREDKPRKVYFDFDFYVDNEIKDIKNNDTFVKLMALIKKYMTNAKFSVSGSCGYDNKKKSYKLSLHIIVNNYHFKSLNHQNEYIKYFAKYLNADPLVYGRNQCFKMPNQSKMKDKRIQKVIIDDNLLNHVIQSINNDSIEIKKELNNFNNLNSMIKVSKSKLNKIKIERVVDYFYTIDKKLKKPFIHKFHSSALDILKALPIYPKTHHNNLKYSDYFFVLGFCQLEEIPFDDVWELTKGRQSKYDKDYWLEKYNSIKQYNDKIPKTKIKLVRKSKRIKFFDLLSLFYGEFGDIYLQQFKNDQIDNKFKFDQVIKSKYINLKDIINVKNKIIIEKLGMGSGKTNNLNLLMRIQKNKSVVSLTNRKSLAENQLGEFNKVCDANEIKRIEEVTDKKCLTDGNNFTHYSQKNSNDADRLICEIESINRFKNKKYDVVIIDEIESLFLSFANDKCHNKKYTDNWVTFIDMCINAKKIYCLDAYISKRTNVFFKDILPNEQLYFIAKKNDVIDKKVRMYHHNAYDKFLKKLEECIKANKKICFQYPYKSGKSSYFKQSIDDIKNLITKYGNYKDNQVLNYHGDTDEKKKKELAHVNNVWNKTKDGDDVMCVIYNGSISVGVNCNVEYDKLFLTYADHLFARSTIQGSMRFRKFKDDTIECYCYKNITFDTDFDFKPYQIAPLSFKECNFMNHEEKQQYIEDNFKKYDIAHKHLFDGIKHEHEAKGFGQLEYLFKVTGYKIVETIVNEEKLDIKQIKANIHTSILDMKTNFDSFHNIPDINEQQYQKLLKIQKAGAYYTEEQNGKKVSIMCSQLDRYKIRKYAINKMFKTVQEYNNDLIEPMTELEENRFKMYTEVVKSELFDKTYILEGFRDVNKGYKCINLVINKDYSLNYSKLTDEDKYKIKLHYELGKNWESKSDYFIKSKIAQCHFIKNIIKNPKGLHKFKYEDKFESLFIDNFIKFGSPHKDEDAWRVEVSDKL